MQNGILIAHQERSYWPVEHWQFQSLDTAGFSEESVQAALDLAFKIWKTTDAILIVRAGKIVIEQYREPYHENKRHYLWSVSKSVANGLVGRAEQLGLLKRGQFIGELLPNFVGTDKNKSHLTVDHLLRMESGLGWNEAYEYNPLFSDVLAMLYGKGHRDMASYAGGKPSIAEPGDQLYYSSGTSNLLCHLLRKVFPDQTSYDRFPWKEFFDKLGVRSAVWEQDSKGSFVCSSYLYLTARDLARLGFLFLNNGFWNGEQLLPETWVYTTTTDTLSKREHDYSHAYGSLWYMNFDRTDRKYKRTFPAAPPHTFWAKGHWGQYLIIIPESDTMIIRFGNDRKSQFPMDQFISLLLRK